MCSICFPSPDDLEPGHRFGLTILAWPRPDLFRYLCCTIQCTLSAPGRRSNHSSPFCQMSTCKDNFVFSVVGPRYGTVTSGLSLFIIDHYNSVNARLKLTFSAVQGSGEIWNSSLTSSYLNHSNEWILSRDITLSNFIHVLWLQSNNV